MTLSEKPRSVGLLLLLLGPSKRPLPYNTQHLQEINIHVSSGIRTSNPRKGAAADPHLRPRGR